MQKILFQLHRFKARVIAFYILFCVSGLFYLNGKIQIQLPTIKNHINKFKENSSISSEYNYNLRLTLLKPEGLSPEQFLLKIRTFNRYLNQTDQITSIISPFTLEFGHYIKGKGYFLDNLLSESSSWADVDLKTRLSQLKNRKDSPLRFFIDEKLSWISWVISTDIDLDQQESYRLFRRHLFLGLSSIEGLDDSHLYFGGLLGEMIISDSLMTSEQKEIWPLIFFALLFIVTAYVRSVKQILLFFSVFLATSIASFIIAAMKGGTLGPMSQYSIVYITSIILADSLYLIHHFKVASAKDLTEKEACAFVINNCALPCLFTSLTAFLGFFAMISSSHPDIQLIGYICSFGLAFGFFVMMIMYSSFGYQKNKKLTSNIFAQNRLISFYNTLFIHSKPVMICYFSALFLGSAYLISVFQFSGHELRILRNTSRNPESPRIEQHKNLTQEIPNKLVKPYLPVEITLSGSRLDKQLLYQYLQHLDQFLKTEVKPSAESFHIESVISDYWEGHGVQYNGEADKRASAIYDLPDEYTESVYLNQNQFVFQLNLDEEVIRGEGINSFIDILESENRKILNALGLDHIQSKIISPHKYLSDNDLDNCRRLVYSSIFSCVIIGLLFLLIFRSKTVVAIVFFSNLSALILPLLYLYINYEGLIYPAAMALCIIVAVCSDDTMHLIAGFYKKGSAFKCAALDSIVNCFWPTLQTTIAIIFIIGMLHLGSVFLVNEIIFHIVAIGLGSALFSDLIITPVLMKAFLKKTNNSINTDL